MTRDRRHQIDAWLQAALDLDDEAERSLLLDRGCPPELRCDVDRLLVASRGPDALPSVARLRIEALWEMDRGCEPPHQERDEEAAGPCSPWSCGASG